MWPCHRRLHRNSSSSAGNMPFPHLPAAVPFLESLPFYFGAAIAEIAMFSGPKHPLPQLCEQQFANTRIFLEVYPIFPPPRAAAPEALFSVLERVNMTRAPGVSSNARAP